MDRNFMVAIVLSMAVILGWDLLILAPQREAAKAARAVEQTLNATQELAPTAPVISGSAPDAKISLEEALARAPGRVAIDTPSLKGSISLAGARIDDLSLKSYRETLDPESALIRLLSPPEAADGHYVEQGWIAAGAATESLVWSAPAGAVLTPATPVTLSLRQGTLVFEKTIAVDDRFMFTLSQTVRNEGAELQTVTPYGLVVQRGVPVDAGKFMILHEGPLAVVDNSLFERKYKRAKTAVVEKSGERGWVGVTNKYWLAAAVPPQNQPFRAELRNVGTEQAPVFRASYSLESRSVPPGGEITLVSHLFGGAKDVDVLQSYERDVEKGGLGVWKFDKAVDWGNFFFLTRPIFHTLNYFGDMSGNFGIAILLLTLVIKGLMFPLANKAYESMSKMKKLQPEIQKLQARFKDDKPKMQQEMMALYQKEKMNPLAGCLPIIVQMPIFYALYKVLFVTIELRHEPFFGWLRDLSAPDPTSIFNLFGLIPYEPTALPLIGPFLGVGVLPILMGVSMWFQMKLNPPPTDPVQQQVFAIMPWLFMFLFASFASGLVLYWFWNTVLSIAQQWYIMKRNGVSVDWGDRLPFVRPKKTSGAPAAAPGETTPAGAKKKP